MFSWLTNLLATINMIVWLGATGFMVGLGALFAGRIVSGLKAYLVAGSVGALLVLGTYWTGVVDHMVSGNAKAEIASLKAEKASLDHELKALNAVLAKEREQLVKEQETVAANAVVFEKLNAIIALHQENISECPGIAVFADELEAIGELK